MDVLEPFEELVEVLTVLTKILVELVLPSTVLLIGLFGYAVLRYMAGIMKSSPKTPFYSPMEMWLSGFEVILALLALASSVFALRHLKELPF